MVFMADVQQKQNAGAARGRCDTRGGGACGKHTMNDNCAAHVKTPSKASDELGSGAAVILSHSALLVAAAAAAAASAATASAAPIPRGDLAVPCTVFCFQLKCCSESHCMDVKPI